MRVKLTLFKKGNIRLGLNYKEHIQGLIYGLFQKDFSKWLHNTGFIHQNRKYKLFTFSGIIDRYTFDYSSKSFIFNNEISFFIDSTITELSRQILSSLNQLETLKIGSELLNIQTVSLIKSKYHGENSIRINAIEPIEVHRTSVESGQTYYFNPTEKEFSQYVNENLRKKWMIFNKKTECDLSIEISPINFEKCKERIQTFKGTVIKGWSGHYQITGDAELIEIALRCGLGSSNSKGYGMIEVVERRGL